MQKEQPHTYLRVDITDIAHSGQGIGTAPDGSAVWVWDAYPGERVHAEVFRRRGHGFEAVARSVENPAPFRVEPCEQHFLITSPWQTLSFAQEQTYKHLLTTRLVQDVFPSASCVCAAPVTDGKRVGYRNAMEFGVTRSDGTAHLALFARGRKRLVPVSGTILAMDTVNVAAQEALLLLSEYDPEILAGTCELRVRVNRVGEACIGIIVADPALRCSNAFHSVSRNTSGSQDFLAAPTRRRGPKIGGYVMYWKEDHILHEIDCIGDGVLQEMVLGKACVYDCRSFFQPNVPVFERAVSSLQPFVAQEHVVEYYSGVGAISIALSEYCASARLVESDAYAVAYANRCIAAQELHHFSCICERAGQQMEALPTDAVLIVDPPREGLAPEMLACIRASRPKRIIYLSCKPWTQMRDCAALADLYACVHFELFNFFPRTPHSECLLVLERLHRTIR